MQNTLPALMLKVPAALAVSIQALAEAKPHWNVSQKRSEPNPHKTGLELLAIGLATAAAQGVDGWRKNAAKRRNTPSPHHTRKTAQHGQNNTKG
jgi:hypothetical protein